MCDQRVFHDCLVYKELARIAWEVGHVSRVLRGCDMWRIAENGAALFKTAASYCMR